MPMSTRTPRIRIVLQSKNVMEWEITIEKCQKVRSQAMDLILGVRELLSTTVSQEEDPCDVLDDCLSALYMI